AAAVLQAISNSALSPSQTGRTIPAAGKDATNRSIPPALTHLPELAEFSSQMAKFPGAVVRATSNLPASVGQQGQAVPAPYANASDPSTPLFVTGAPSLAAPLTQMGQSTAADLLAGSNPLLPTSETGEPASALDQGAGVPASALGLGADD